jgi:hypothetical protein
MSSCGDQTKCTMYVLFMLLVNGVAIAMVVIGAINSGRQPISNFPAKNIFWEIFLNTKKSFRGFLRQIESEVFYEQCCNILADFILFHVYKISRLLSPEY